MGRKVKLEHWECRDSGSRGREKAERGAETHRVRHRSVMKWEE